MNSLFSVLISTLRAKITPIWTRFRYWTSWNYIKANVLTRIRQALSKIFQIRPRDKDDYYPLFGFLVSKPLAHAAIIVVGILSLCYFVWVNPIANVTEGIGKGEKIYSYNSLPLRFTNGNVKIKAKSGYVAYDGYVEKGYATGFGKLFDEKDQIVYQGNFEKNKYEGQGTLFYPSGQTRYEGEFLDNHFEGNGTYFRESGTKLYTGQFSRGVFEGDGTLYDSSATEVFKGIFHSGEPAYSQLLGKTTGDIGTLYTGTPMIYQNHTDMAVIMDEIDAFYLTTTENSSMSDEIKTSAVYVGKSEMVYGEHRMSTIEELRQVLGNPVFEGNSYITFPEAVGIHWLQKKGCSIPIEVKLETKQLFDEVSSVEGYDGEAMIYLYVFQTEDISYTFLSTDRNSGFFMYVLE